METPHFQLQGMSCAACASAIETAIQKVSGVDYCSVNFGAEQATVAYNPALTSLEKIEQAVTQAGYRATRYAVVEWKNAAGQKATGDSFTLLILT